MEKYTYVGKTEEEALEEALKELGVSKEEILYKTNEQKGGLFKSKKVEIEVMKKNDIHEFIKESLLKIARDMGFDVNAEVKVRDDILNITL
jgi:predicted RNA-binding protein Jag